MATSSLAATSDSGAVCAVVEGQRWLRRTFLRAVRPVHFFEAHLHGLTYAELLVLLLFFVPKVFLWLGFRCCMHELLLVHCKACMRGIPSHV